jgi:four helix bundle protein
MFRLRSPAHLIYWSVLEISVMAFMFERLKVYQKAIDFADEVATATESFPDGYSFLKDQLNRASLSISTNIAEGNGRFTKADRKNFFTIARGSVQECVPLLELARRRQLIDADTQSNLITQLETLAKMISGLINGLEKRKTESQKPARTPHLLVD